MSIIEKTIAAISPRWAAERAVYRQAIEQLVQARAYTAAKGGRRGDGWISGGGGPNAEIGLGAQRIRERARDLVRNNPYAAGYPAKMAAKIIGSGIQPRLALLGDQNKEARAKARGIWDRFCDNSDPERLTDFYGQQYQAAQAEAESGEVLIRTIRLPSSAKAAFPLQIVVQEADYIDSAKTELLKDGNIVIQGVEFNQWGQRVAYWLYDDHPGESSTSFARRMPTSSRVDAADIDHIFERRRPGQVRGISPFAAVAMKMRDLDDYDDAELMRKKIAACFAAFVRKPASGLQSPLAQAKGSDTQGRSIENLAPAMIKYLDVGEEVTFGEPPSVDGYTEYAFGQLYGIAAGLGCTFEQLTGYLKNVNYSSMRIGENTFQDLLDHKQWHVYIPNLCRSSWNRVGQVARIRGEIGVKDPWAAKWITPRRRWLDPKTDVDATSAAVRNLLISAPDAISGQGYDVEDVLDETQEFNKGLDSRGIVTDIDPRKVGKTSAASPAAAKNDTAPADEAA